MTTINLKDNPYRSLKLRDTSVGASLLETPHVTNIISSNELQENLLKATDESEFIDAFCAWGSQHGAFSDISYELWEKIQNWRSPPKQSER